MSTEASIETLEMRIEQLVREHVAAIRAAATTAVARALAEPVRGSSKATGPRASSRRPSRQRRSGQEIAELGERLVQAIEATPGATMSTLSAQVGATPRELAIAVKHLRRQDRVRTVGQRQHTKYFPAAPGSVSAVS
jgi:hypothetical protein